MRLLALLPAILLAACVPAASDPPLPIATHTMLAAVNFTVGQYTADAYTDHGPCQPSGDWASVKRGATIRVTDPNGTLIAIGKLEVPYLLGTDPATAECRVLAHFGVPDAGAYAFDIAGAWSETIPAADLRDTAFNWIFSPPS